ncbi:unnamed protein product [Urochloa decumbens]|uniref:MADS-box domain-containing protein n=1 Tax=Urochloa decumbens TaxID=240449 RepID=A0ABC9DZ86_9POAL
MVKPRESFRKRRPTLFAAARELAEEFDAHVAVVAFSPTGEAHAFGAPTADSVLRTYLPADGPPPPLPAPGAAVGAETAAEAAARVARMRRELKETKVLVAAEWGRVADACEKIREAQAAAKKDNWWEVDIDALGEEELPVFTKALEMLKTDVQKLLDAMASDRASLQPRGKQ